MVRAVAHQTLLLELLQELVPQIKDMLVVLVQHNLAVMMVQAVAEEDLVLLEVKGTQQLAVMVERVLLYLCLAHLLLTLAVV